MATESFRTPMGIHADKAPAQGIKPEKALNLELEAGYQLTPELFFQTNIFDIQFSNVIMYQAGAGGGASTYSNVGFQRSQGLEAELKYKEQKTSVSANYSYYKNLTSDETYRVDGEPSANLGLPQHRINVLGGYRFNEIWSIHPSVAYFGKKYAQIWTDGDAGVSHQVSMDPAFIVNLNVRVRDVLTKGLEVDFGGHNLTDTKDFLPQAYKGYVNPLPVASRSWMVRLGYTANL